MTLDRLLAVFADSLDCSTDSLSTHDKFRDHPNWDSLASLTLLSAFQDFSDKPFSLAELARLDSISDVYDYFANDQ